MCGWVRRCMHRLDGAAHAPLRTGAHAPPSKNIYRPLASTATLSTTLLGTMIKPSSVANVV